MKVKLLDETRISLFNFFYLFSLIIYAGGATKFAIGLCFIHRLGCWIGLLLSLIFVYKNNLKIYPNFVKVVVIFSCYALLTFINNRVISPLWYIEILISLTIAYIICQGYKNRLFILYETILYKLCIISLIFWFIHLLFPSYLIDFVTKFQFSSPYLENNNVLANIIVYTINAINPNEYVLLIRNSGFAWEPGAFSCFICMGIFCNLLRSGLTFKHNRPLLVFVFTLFTTQSTTGFVIFIAMSFMYVLSNGKIYIAIILIPLLLLIFQMPFVSDKISAEYNNIENINLYDYSGDTYVSLGRMYSLKLDYEEFLRHPILGLGGYNEGTFLRQFGFDNIGTISGLGKLLSKYGIIISILFFVNLYFSIKLIMSKYNKNGILLFIPILGMMFSYNLWTHPLYVCFWMYSFFLKNIRYENSFNSR